MEGSGKKEGHPQFTVRLESLYPPYRIPTEAHLTVCEKIQEERPVEGVKFEKPLAIRWCALTRPLRLAGSEVMRPNSEGSLSALECIVSEAPWSRALIEDLERQLLAQVTLGRPWAHFEPLLLVGEAGVGKTWFARRLGSALGVASAALELGSTTDDRTLSGTARGWSNTQPAWPLIVMDTERIANPLLILDEIDKAGGSDRYGHVHKALLGMLERSSAVSWYDQCLMANCDISQANWVACANEVSALPKTLLSRFRVVEVPPVGTQDFEPLLRSIMQETARSWDVPVAMLPDLPPLAYKVLRDRFLRRRSIRTLARDTRALLTAALADGHGPRRH